MKRATARDLNKILKGKSQREIYTLSNGEIFAIKKGHAPILKLFELIGPYICHNAWVAYQIGAGQKYNIEPTAANVKSHEDAICAFIKNPKMTSAENHQNWCNYKYSIGWKYGKVKDEKKKTHPDLLPFSKLPLVEQNKDVCDLEARRFAYMLVIGMTKNCCMN